jgi:predicted O-methyltransferase YrrM
MSLTTIGLAGRLYDYYATVACREPAILAELRAATAKLGEQAEMQIGPEQGAFMAMLVRLVNPRHIVEIGTFTGYSSLAMALAGEARLTCADISAEWTATARRFWAKAGVAGRIDLSLDGGQTVIDRLLAQGAAGTVDLMFIDADKPAYDSYYEAALKLLRPGGLVLIDNVLWGGDVADPARTDKSTAAIRALNAKIVADPRVDMILVPIGDGLTLARKR